MTYRRETDHARARKFAVEWATKDSGGDIANLARAYLNAKHELERPIRELHEQMVQQKLKTTLERENEHEKKLNCGLEYVRRDKDGNELERISPSVPRAVAAFARWTIGAAE